MTREEFARVYKQLPIILQPGAYMELANSTRYIDYGCEFKDGKCACKTTEKCCCGGCNSSKGHFEYRFENIKIQNEIIDMFDDRTGFWREYVGCILPRKYRSITCLRYHCKFDTLILLMDIIANKLYDYVNRRPVS